MFTGKLSNMSRSEAKSLIEQNSGSIVSNVTKKLDYLIVGEKPTNRKVLKSTAENSINHILNKPEPTDDDYANFL